MTFPLWNRHRGKVMRTGQHLILIFFLVTTLNAFLVTVWRVHLRFVPWWPTYLSYSAMAPYQSGGTTRIALAAEGQLESGDWREIDLRPYFPLARGRDDVRMLQIGWLRLASSMTLEADESYTRKFRKLAHRLIELERAKGRHFKAVRLSWDEWPSSHQGHDARYNERQRSALVSWP